MGNRPVILVIEDEPLIGMVIADRVEDAGCLVLGPVGDASSAVALAQKGSFDAALLDANLAGSSVHGIADLLTAAGKPFAFVTGYGREAISKRYRDARVLTKPFDEEELCQLVRDLVACRDPAAAG